MLSSRGWALGLRPLYKVPKEEVGEFAQLFRNGSSNSAVSLGLTSFKGISGAAYAPFNL